MKKAFTLVEIIIVIAVLTVIAAFSVGQYSNVMASSRLAKVKTDLKTVKDAVSVFMVNTEKAPIGLAKGVDLDKVTLNEYEYIIVNLELLTKEYILDNGIAVSPAMTSIPSSSRYTKSSAKNSRKQEPSFIYVMDSNYNVYLADGEKDKATGYFINTKIFEVKDSNIYEETVKMNYTPNLPILEDLDYSAKMEIKDTDIVLGGSEIITPGDITFPGYDSGSNPGDIPGENNTGNQDASNKAFVKNVSVAGYTIFLDIKNIDFSKLESVNMDVIAGVNKHTIELYPISSTRWFGRVDSIDLNYFSGNYKSTINVSSKDKKTTPVGTFETLIDRINPSLTISKSSSDFHVEKPITITLNSKDTSPSSGIKIVEYKINDGDWEEYTKPFQISKADYYKLEARCEDKFGNMSSTILSIINDYTKPEVYLSKTNSGVTIDIGADVADEDVLWKNGFETVDSSVRLHHSNTPKYGYDGGQFISNKESFDGDRSYELLKNNDGNGNYYSFPSTKENRSFLSFGSLNHVIKNNTHLALVYRYKGYGDSTINESISGGWARKINNHNIIITENTPKGVNKLKLNTLEGISLGGHITTDTDDLVVMQMPQIIAIDKNTNTITLSEKIVRSIDSGETLKYRVWRNGGAFKINNTKDTNNEWRLFTSIMKTTNFADYDLYDYGTGHFFFVSLASDRLYMDNIKMGFAPRLILYKNGVRFNMEAQEYTTNYTDNNIPDKAAPQIYDMSIESIENNFNISVNAKDEGTIYSYHIDSITRSGKITSSNPRTITTTSGIVKYHYVIDNNPSTTNIPRNNPTPDSVINKTLDLSKTWYIHVIAEDNSGNISKVAHERIN